MNKNLHPVDEFFRKGIEGHQEEPDDRVWGYLDSSLDKQALYDTERKYRFLKRAIAAMLVLSASVAIALWVAYPSDKGKESSQNKASLPKSISHSKASSTESEKLTGPVRSKESKTQSSSLPSISVNANDRSFKELNSKGLSQPANSEFSHGNDRENKFKSETVSIYERNKNRPEERDIQGIAKDTEFTGGKNLRGGGEVSTIKNEKIVGNELIPVVSDNPSALFEGLTLPRLAGIDLFAQKSLTPSEKASNAISIAAIRSKRTKKMSFSVSPFIMPEQASLTLREGKMEHHEDRREIIRQGESVKTSNSYGVNVYVDYGQQLSLLSGISVSSTTSTIMPRPIYARPHRQRPGQAPSQENRYKINCSTGYAYVNTKTGTTVPSNGDSIQGLTSTSRVQHIVVPLGARYMIGKGKIGFGVMGGVNLNFLSSANLDVNYQEPTGQKEQSTIAIEGVKSMYLSSFIGLSLEYSLTNKINFQLSPIKTMGLSSMNKNTPATSKKSTTGAQLGIRFKL